MQSKPPTIKDIAEFCGVSKSLVGYILSDSPTRRGSPEVRERVQKAARKLGYRPNLAARMLVGKSSRLIGVNIATNAPQVNFRCLSAMVQEAKKRGYRLMVSQNSGSADELLAAYRTFQEYRVNGMIFWDPELPAGTPVPARFHELNDVLFIGRPPVDGPRFIDIDWSTGTQAAAEHFLAIRRRHPVLITDRASYHSVEARIDGFRRAMRQAGRRENEDFSLIRIDYSPEPATLRKTLEQVIDEALLPRGIDAVLAHNDLCALHLLQLLERRSIEVPRQIAVIGFDNDPFAAAAIPPLASIDQNVERQATAALDLLTAAIEARDGVPAPPRSLRIPCSLVLRVSAADSLGKV